MTRLKVLNLLLFACILQYSQQTIPPSMWKKLSNFDDTTAFINDMLMKKPESERPKPGQKEDEDFTDIIFTKQGSIDPEGRDAVAGSVSTKGGCIPKEYSLQVPPHSDPNVVYWPTCAPVDRCGGCCGHEMLECAPVQASVKEVQVLRARYPYPGAERFVFEGMHNIEMEQHHACECRCRVQARHCHPTKHTYDADNCQCICKNEAQSGSCPPHKKWHPHQCECTCPVVTECFRNEVFSNATCRCEMQTTTPSPTTKTAAVKLLDCSTTKCRYGYVPVTRQNRCVCEFAPPSNNGPSIAVDGPVNPGGLPGIGGLPLPPRLPLPQYPIRNQPPPRRQRRHRGSDQ